MIWQNIALGAAGAIGGGVALIHGALIQKAMVRPLVTTAGLSGMVRRLAPPLLQFTTFNWFVGGMALIALASGIAPEARLAICLLVGSSYLFGAIGNYWATRGRHPGWVLYGIALALIAAGLIPASG